MALLTIGNYALLSVVWGAILALYLRSYRVARVQDSLVAGLAAMLALDAFKNVVEDIYFGVLWSGRYGLWFTWAEASLSNPLALLMPKLLNLAVALVILFVLIRKWIPAELHERTLQKDRQTDLREELVRSLEAVRAQEERWQLALLASQDGIWDYDAATGKIWTSPRYEAQLGYEPGDLAGRQTLADWKESLHPEDRDAVVAAFDDLLAGRTLACSHEFRARAHDGAYRRVLARCVAKAEPDGPATRVVFSQTDVTEQREAEAALAARQRVESLGMLASGVAHDFNNLLAVIRGNAALVRDEVKSEGGATALSDLETAIERAADLTSRLLAYSGRGRFVVGPLDLSGLGREMARLLGSSAPPEIRVETAFADGLPPIEADAAQLQQLFMNLFTNAVDALRGPGGTVALRTRREHVTSPVAPVAAGEEPLPPGDYVVLEVEDTGIGMGEATRLRIFDPFFSRKGPSRGMGLSAMLGILRAHGAGMRVSTSPGVGTTFTVLFPFTALPLAAPAEAPPPSLAPPLVERRRRALVADDEPMLRRLFTRVLEGAGYEVEAVENGRVARTSLESRGGDYSLVILDITMPEVTGSEVLAWLRAAGDRTLGAVPVILTSGYAEEGATLDEHTRFLKKPFAAKELAALVAELAK
jgi:two-component system, cell cycle sensor histidine kinase and response regulator CckA